MNKVQIVGRITRDPELRQAGETTITRFTVAVDRRMKKDEADFISCVAFGKTAEFIEKYFKKGNRIGICGRIQTGSYENKDGQKIYTTDVIAEEAEFVESKQTDKEPAATPDGFMNIPEGIVEDLPFN